MADDALTWLQRRLIDQAYERQQARGGRAAKLKREIARTKRALRYVRGEEVPQPQPEQNDGWRQWAAAPPGSIEGALLTDCLLTETQMIERQRTPPVVIVGGVPQEERRQALERRLHVPVIWPPTEWHRRITTEPLIRGAQLLVINGWNSHKSSGEARLAAKKWGVPFVEADRSLNVGRLVEQIEPLLQERIG
jgi:hypothetical protein